jgi:hypothetical protein
MRLIRMSPPLLLLSLTLYRTRSKRH